MPTIATFVGNGVQTNFTFAFDYLRKAFVKVVVDAVATPFVFITDFTIQITPAPAVGKVIIIRRDTDKNRLVTFVDGSILIANDLNVAALQAIHIAAEAYDQASTSLAIDATGAYTAGFRRLADIGLAVNPNDAMSKAAVAAAIAGNIGPQGPAGPTGSNGLNGLDFPGFSTATLAGATTLANSNFTGNKHLSCISASPFTLTLNTGLIGTEPLLISQRGAGQITIAGTATLLSRNGLKTAGVFAVITLIPAGTNTYLVAGDTAV